MKNAGIVGVTSLLGALWKYLMITVESSIGSYYNTSGKFWAELLVHSEAVIGAMIPRLRTIEFLEAERSFMFYRSPLF